MVSVESEEEKHILQKFQNRVKDLAEDEVTLIRFLKARSFNLDQAEEMIRNNADWRKKMLPTESNIYKVPDFILDNFPCGFTGLSHQGGPVLFVRFGCWDVKHWIKEGKSEEIFTFIINLLESSLKRCKFAGDKQLVAIYDLEGLSYTKATHMESIKMAYRLFQILEQNYPEVLQNLVVFNAPWIFQTVFNMVKPVISAQTMDKLQVIGCDKNEYLPAIQKLVPDKCLIDQDLKL